LKRIRYEMNITRSEFERLLPAAVAHAAFAVEGGDYVSMAGPPRWRVRLGPERIRRIALIRLPLRDVEIELEGFDDAGAEAFRKRFDLYFQKGGG
jgi:hypothetical protein